MIITHSVHGLHPLDIRFRGRYYGFVGVAMLSVFRGQASQTALGALQAFASGILAYIALEIGAEVAEYVERLAKWETFGLLLRNAVLTTAVFAGVFLLLSWVERRATARGMPQSLLTAFIVALAYGVHNGGSRSPAPCFLGRG